MMYDNISVYDQASWKFEIWNLNRNVNFISLQSNFWGADKLQKQWPDKNTAAKFCFHMELELEISTDLFYWIETVGYSFKFSSYSKSD